MKLKHLESALSTIDYKFANPRIEYEQYATSPHLAACVALAAFERGDLGHDTSVADLGCGTGMLSIASACLGAHHILAIDVDPLAIQQAKRNVEQMNERNDDNDVIVDFIQAELQHVPSSSSRNHHQGRRSSTTIRKKKPTATVTTSDVERIHDFGDDDGIPLSSNCVDTVLINPPFGTKHNAGIDVAFLLAGCRLARNVVYSFHKTSTRAHILKRLLQSNLIIQCDIIAEMKFDIPHMYKFHKQKNGVDIQVDLIRVLVKNTATLSLLQKTMPSTTNSDNDNDSESNVNDNDDYCST